MCAVFSAAFGCCGAGCLWNSEGCGPTPIIFVLFYFFEFFLLFERSKRETVILNRAAPLIRRD
jgi:hypothetical protein